MGSMIDRLVRSFFPCTCPVCGEAVKGKTDICAECKNEIKYITESKCEKCGKPLLTEEVLWCADCRKINHFFDKGISVFEYVGAFKETMYKFKYGNVREYGEFFGRKTADRYDKLLKKWMPDVIVPVPMYNKKEIKRGYNQAWVFGHYLSKYTGITLDDKLLIRRNSTLPQKELSDEMRRVNLQKAFAVNTERISNYRKVLLVDDIYTTGSTMDACAKVLKIAGVDKVYFACVSAGIDKQ